DRNRSHWSTSKTPSYTKSVSWQHHRLAIHSNAEMYAWINSAQGARELNLPSVYGDAAEWNTAELRREMSHS
ncbi:hypothetical protein PSZ80_05255, partial [Shigella sonnei]|nr:hypothetical protein [Shigella sonnei]MDD0420704.1 hypothetical protein [Shigella sonnei]MDD0425073.1 hypothetical protein [Shigella sonnei]MDD0426199.1 hypothetical protein [Shigella sonnei]MDD0430649.1 hypothetical protein [Shigella sonnei]